MATRWQNHWHRGAIGSWRLGHTWAPPPGVWIYQLCACSLPIERTVVTTNGNRSRRGSAGPDPDTDLGKLALPTSRRMIVFVKNTRSGVERWASCCFHWVTSLTWENLLWIHINARQQPVTSSLWSIPLIKSTHAPLVYRASRGQARTSITSMSVPVLKYGPLPVNASSFLWTKQELAAELTDGRVTLPQTAPLSSRGWSDSEQPFWRNPPTKHGWGSPCLCKPGTGAVGADSSSSHAGGSAAVRLL